MDGAVLEGWRDYCAPVETTGGGAMCREKQGGAEDLGERELAE